MPVEICENLDYFDYLMSRLKISDEKVSNYSELFMRLLSTPFFAVNPEDNRRVNDALYLRSGYNSDFEKGINDVVSVLEVLVIFSERIENEYIGDPSNPRPYGIFLKMLENLGLLRFDNDHWDPIMVDKIVERWLNGNYDSNGNGSPFLINKICLDFRKKNMWDQMMAYINENF